MIIRTRPETLRAVSEALRAAVDGSPDGWRDQLSDYWQEHLAHARLEARGSNELVLNGQSGFYFPLPREAASWPERWTLPLKHLGRSFEIRQAERYLAGLRSMLDGDALSRRCYGLSIPQPAQDVSHFGTKVAGRHLSSNFIQAKHSLLNFLAACRLDGKDISKAGVFLEIGAGTGLLASCVKQLWPDATYVIVDLPHILVNSSVFLSNCFPEKKFYFYDGSVPSPERMRDYDFVLLPHFEAGAIAGDFADVAWNEDSMQEMTPAVIGSYFTQIRRILKPGGLFFCANRAEKIMDGKPIRFREYPWRPDDRVLLDSLNHFLAQCRYIAGRKWGVWPIWSAYSEGPQLIRVAEMAKR